MVCTNFAKLYIYRRGPRQTACGCTVATATAVAHGGRGIFKIVQLFYLNLDGGKLYMKIVAFDEM
jgi:hypothetical protein